MACLSGMQRPFQILDQKYHNPKTDQESGLLMFGCNDGIEAILLPLKRSLMVSLEDWESHLMLKQSGLKT